MKKRMGFGALLGAGALVFAMVGSAAALPPAYAVTVTKTAFPASVPAEGGDVMFTVSVENTGVGDLHTVNVADDMVGCTLDGPVADAGSDGILSEGETWDYTCTVTGVDPDTTNTASVAACHNSSPNCNQDAHDAVGQGQVTVGLCESDCEVLPTDAPSAAPSAAPTGAGLPTEAPTDTAGVGSSSPANTAWLLIVALGVLLGSVVVLRPASVRPRR